MNFESGSMYASSFSKLLLAAPTAAEAAASLVQRKAAKSC